MGGGVKPTCAPHFWKCGGTSPRCPLLLHPWYFTINGSQLGMEFYLFVPHGGMNDRGSTCKFRNARSAFRNLHVDPLSFIPFEIYTWIPCLLYLHEKQTRRIQSLYLYFIKIVLAMKYPFLNTQQGCIQNSRRSSRLIRHACRLLEKWMSKYFLCLS